MSLVSKEGIRKNLTGYQFHPIHLRFRDHMRRHRYGVAVAPILQAINTTRVERSIGGKVVDRWLKKVAIAANFYRLQYIGKKSRGEACSCYVLLYTWLWGSCSLLTVPKRTASKLGPVCLTTFEAVCGLCPKTV